MEIEKFLKRHDRATAATRRLADTQRKRKRATARKAVALSSDPKRAAILASKKRYRERNKDKILAYRKKTADKARQVTKAWRAANPDTVKAIRRGETDRKIVRRFEQVLESLDQRPTPRKVTNSKSHPAVLQ